MGISLDDALAMKPATQDGGGQGISLDDARVSGTQATPPQPDEYRLGAARKAAGPGASEAEVRELAAKMPPPPERGVAEQQTRGLTLGAQGIGEGVANTIGFLPDQWLKLTNATGATNYPPGMYSKALRDWGSGQIGQPGKTIPTAEPENMPERITHGTSEGIGSAIATLGIGEGLGAARGVGPTTQAVGRGMASQPGLQALGGAAGGATSEATGNPWLGLLAGVLTPTVGVRMASRLLNPVTNRLTPELQRLAGVGEDLGIRFSAGDLSGSKVLQKVESVLGELPGASGGAQDAAAQKAEGFNRASMSFSRTRGDYPTADALSTRQGQIGGDIGAIAERNSLDPNVQITRRIPAPTVPGQPPPPPTQSLTAELADIAQQARTLKLTEVSETVRGLNRELLSHIDPTTGRIPGSFYRHFDNLLGDGIKMAGPDATGSNLAGALRQVRTTVRNAFDASVSPQDADAWHQARREYANSKVTQAGMNSAGQEAAAGNLPPASLRGAVDQSLGRGSYGAGAGDQNDLAHIGQSQLMRTPLGNSGTAIRAYLMAALTGGPAALAHGDLSPTAAGLGTAGAVALPYALQRLINTGAGRAYLGRGLVPGGLEPGNTVSTTTMLADRLMEDQRPLPPVQSQIPDWLRR